MFDVCRSLRFLALVTGEKACYCYRSDKHNRESNVRIKVGLYLHNSSDNNEGEEKNAGKNDLFRRNLFHRVSLTTIEMVYLSTLYSLLMLLTSFYDQITIAGRRIIIDKSPALCYP